MLIRHSFYLFQFYDVIISSRGSRHCYTYAILLVYQYGILRHIAQIHYHLLPADLIKFILISKLKFKRRIAINIIALNLNSTRLIERELLWTNTH